MAGKGGAKTGTKSWDTSDLDFDDDGCLEIKDTELGNALLRAMTNEAFKIWMYDPFSPGSKINIQCTC